MLVAALAITLSGCKSMFVMQILLYSGTPLNGHPSTADTHDITDNSESPDYPSINFNTSELVDTHRSFQQDCPPLLLGLI